MGIEEVKDRVIMDRWKNYLPCLSRKAQHRVMTLNLYNTVTRRQKPFDPWDAEKISLGQPLTVVISTNFKDIYSNIKEQ